MARVCGAGASSTGHSSGWQGRNAGERQGARPEGVHQGEWAPLVLGGHPGGRAQRLGGVHAGPQAAAMRLADIPLA